MTTQSWSMPDWAKTEIEILRGRGINDRSLEEFGRIMRLLHHRTYALGGLWEVPQVDATELVMVLIWESSAASLQLTYNISEEARGSSAVFEFQEPLPYTSPLHPLNCRTKAASTWVSTASWEGLVLRWILLTRNLQPNSMAAYGVAREAIYTLPDEDPALGNLLHTLQARKVRPLNPSSQTLDTLPNTADLIVSVLQRNPAMFLLHQIKCEPDDFLSNFISLVAEGEITCHDDGECTFHPCMRMPPTETWGQMEAAMEVVCGHGSLTIDELQEELGWPLRDVDAYVGRMLRWGWITCEKTETSPYHLLHVKGGR